MSACDHARLTALITGCWASRAVQSAVSLGVADELGKGPATAASVAAARTLHPRSTFRLLRALAGLGLCEHRAGDVFALTEAGNLLRSDVPNSVSILARHWGGRTWSALSQLDDSIRTGEAFKDSGRDGFFSMKDKPEQAHVFNMSMVNLTLPVAPAIVAAYDWSGARSVVDLGGGYGALLAQVLKANPHMTGASADLAYIEPGALKYLADQGVGDRVRYVPTDFFAKVEPGFDLYLLKFIIHDWEDEESIAILGNVAKAAGPKGKVLVIERIVPERAEAGRDEAALRGDIQMLVSTGGVERTQAEYDALFAAAGLRRTRTIATNSPFSILEAVTTT